MPLRRPHNSNTRVADPSRSERDPQTLLAALEAADPGTRRRAARELAGSPGATSALVARLSCESDRSVSEVILAALARQRDPVAVAALATCLRSEDPALRNDAIEAMRALPEGELAPVIGGLLADSDPDVRIFAVGVLAERRDAGLENLLLGVLPGEHHVNVCSALLEVLAEIGTARACAPVEACAARFPDEPFIQYACALVIARAGDG